MLFRALSTMLAFAPALAQAATANIDVRGGDGKPLAGAVVMIDIPKKSAEPIRFSWGTAMGQRNIQFDPRILIVPVGSTVTFPNYDKVRHHVYSFSKTKKFDLKLFGRDESRSVTFDRTGVAAVGCNIHDAMSGFILVVDTPYAMQTDANGHVTIAGVPVGAVTVRVWHPSIRGADNMLAQAATVAPGGLTTTYTIPPLMPGRALRMIERLLDFQHLRTRMTVLFTALFAVALIAVAIVAQVMIRGHAQHAVQAELTTSGSVYDRIWALRAKSLSNSADVLTRDFGFRSAIASGDRPTIVSAVTNLRDRAGVQHAFVVDTDGAVMGDGPADLRAAVGDLPDTFSNGRNDAVITTGGGTYRLVVTPILAPVEIGQVVFAVALDATEMHALERLSAIPLTATMLHRRRDGHWVGTFHTAAPDAAIDRFVRGTISSDESIPTTLRLGGDKAFALAIPLTGRGSAPEAALLLSYPLDQALASYRSLQIGIALAGIAGLILVLLGSRRLASNIARPITALDAAAKALEEGSRAELAVQGSDEIGRLADSFNAMSAGILEREHRITHLAFHDSLTGLPNRTYFRQQLEAALVRAPRMGEKAAVLCLDLDGFKGVNDTLGHPVGDLLLRQVGLMLGDLAQDGMVSRLGGDEFAIILSGKLEEDRVRSLSQTIIDRFRQPLLVDSHQIASGVSIGIAIGPIDGADADLLLKSADLALYRAKQDGRGVFRFFEPALDAAARKRRQLELDLREAILTGQFRLNYQPIFDLAKDRIGCFESLLRWEHPTRGNVSPTEFIPVAEETGLIVAIGEWVMHEACRQAAEWPDHVRVAVNVSPLQFRNSAFSNIIFQALTRSGLPANRLEVEITESVFLDGESGVLQVLHMLRAMGVRIALDDFGTGYSSLSYLRSFPFDKIKIDKSFVDMIAQDESSAAIVHAIVDLAHALKMETTAEGVEDRDQLDELRDQGCSSIQGYWFSRPVEGHAVMDMIAGPMSAVA